MMDTVPTVITQKGMAASWAKTVKSSNDAAGLFRKRARCCQMAGSAAPIVTSDGNIATLVPAYTSIVLFDNDSMCFGGYININTPGIWWVLLTAEWTANAGTGTRSVDIWEATAGRHLALEQKVAFTGFSTFHSIHAVESLGTDAVIQARVSQSSGVNAWFNAGWWGLCLSAFLVSG